MMGAPLEDKSSVGDIRKRFDKVFQKWAQPSRCSCILFVCWGSSDLALSFLKF
jgi:hypothetical protein